MKDSQLNSSQFLLNSLSEACFWGASPHIQWPSFLTTIMTGEQQQPETEQSKLIGAHPSNEGVLSTWLSAEDTAATPNKRHRKLFEKPEKRDDAIAQLAEWLIIHHMSDEMLAKKNAILSKHGFQQYVYRALPLNDDTRKGNIAEIVLCEYLLASSDLELLVFRLRYNPNIDQSMKGDDVLLFNSMNPSERIVLGEAKFRTLPTKKVVDDLMDKFEGLGRLPVSIPFIAQILMDQGKKDLADKLEELNSIIHEKKVPIVNVGFLWSDTETPTKVETSLNSNNPSLIVLSLGMDSHVEFVDKCYARAIRNLKDDDKQESSGAAQLA